MKRTSNFNAKFLFFAIFIFWLGYMMKKRAKQRFLCQQFYPNMSFLLKNENILKILGVIL